MCTLQQLCTPMWKTVIILLCACHCNCLCCWGRDSALILLFFTLHEQWEMFLATVTMLAKFTVLISTIGWHKPSYILQNAKLPLHLSFLCHNLCETGSYERQVWTNWYVQICRFIYRSYIASHFSVAFSTVHTGWKSRISVFLWVGSKTSTVSDYKMDCQTALHVPTFHSF